MSVISISAIDPAELSLLGNNIVAQVQAEQLLDFDAINRSLEAWSEQVDESVLA